jgi:hypothetical protein
MYVIIEVQNCPVHSLLLSWPLSLRHPCENSHALWANVSIPTRTSAGVQYLA